MKGWVRMVIGCLIGSGALFFFGQETLDIVTYALVFSIMCSVDEE